MTQYAPTDLDPQIESDAQVAAIWTTILGVEITHDQVKRCIVATAAAIGTTDTVKALWQQLSE